MTIRTTLSLVIALALSGPVSAQVYKCTDPATGEVVYSQLQCAAGAAVIHAQDKPASTTQSEDNDAIAQRCAASIRFMFKDPESVRVELVGKMGAEVVTYYNARIVAYVLPVWINAHNSYGGYTGAKMYRCYLSQHDKRVLFVE